MKSSARGGGGGLGARACPAWAPAQAQWMSAVEGLPQGLFPVPLAAQRVPLAAPPRLRRRPCPRRAARALARLTRLSAGPGLAQARLLHPGSWILDPRYWLHGPNLLKNWGYFHSMLKKQYPLHRARRCPQAAACIFQNVLKTVPFLQNNNQGQSICSKSA